MTIREILAVLITDLKITSIIPIDLQDDETLGNFIKAETAIRNLVVERLEMCDRYDVNKTLKFLMPIGEQEPVIKLSDALSVAKEL